MNILVADDDASSRLITQMALRSLGHECFTVSDGAQAWEAFRSRQPDVVISDWMMPGLTGSSCAATFGARQPTTTHTSSSSAARAASTRSSRE